jgi:hypothetical protein
MSLVKDIYEKIESDFYFADDFGIAHRAKADEIEMEAHLYGVIHDFENLVKEYGAQTIVETLNSYTLQELEQAIVNPK